MYCILVSYLCCLFWYIVERIQILDYLNISAPVFCFILSIPIGMIMNIYKIIDAMFYNNKVREIISMPVKEKILFNIYISELNTPFIKLETMLFLTLNLYTTNIISVIRYYIASITFIFLFSLLNCCLLLILLKICSDKYSKYFIVFFQYCGYSITLLLTKYLFTFLLFKQKIKFITTFLYIAQTTYFIPLICIGNFIFFFITFILFRHIFLQNIYKIIDSKNQKILCKKRNLFLIKMPYCFLERKRYTGNKEILFYGGLKNFILIALLYNFMTNKYSLDSSLTSMIIIIILCSVNPFSVTAYSSDCAISRIVSITPMNPYKVFQSKVQISFFLNLIILLSFEIIYSFITHMGSEIYLIIIYGFINNYLCSFIGVTLDYLMPHYTESKTELFHGNLNRLLCLAISFFKIFIEVHLIYRLSYTKYLLPIATLLDILLLTAIFICIHKFKEGFTID